MNEMEIEQRKSKQENAGLLEEVQDLQDQLLSANTSLQKERRLQTELEEEIKLLRERLNSPNERLHSPNGHMHECGFADNVHTSIGISDGISGVQSQKSEQVIGTHYFGRPGKEVSFEAIQNSSPRHSSLLNQQLDIVQRGDRISDIWIGQMSANEAANNWVANELQNYIGALAMQEEVVTAICKGIREFEANIENRRPACL